MAQFTLITTTATPKLHPTSTSGSKRVQEAQVQDNEVNNSSEEKMSPEANHSIYESNTVQNILAASNAVTSMYVEDTAKPEIPLIDQTFPTVIVWKNVFLFIYLHVAAIYGAYLFVSGQVYLLSFIWGVPFYTMNGLGITAGCHRLWCHKTYKAKLPLRLLLTFFQTVACQNSIYEWCQDHRVHHKFSETNADPHNSKRGFFFAHMGWLMCRKHPAVKVYGKKIDMSDLANDPIVAWQKKYYIPLVIMVAFVLPTFIPVYCWGESWAASWFFTVTFRYCVMLHFTWLVNSVAHLYGNQPYDKSINPRENKLVGILALGEGWHNYHHTFPWDYKTSELGFYRFNLTTAFLDLMAKIGWAYDLKTVPKHVVLERIRRTGDGTHASQQQQPLQAADNKSQSPSGIDHELEVFEEMSDAAFDHSHLENATWGWGDKDISEKDIQITERLFRLDAANDREQYSSSSWKKER